MSGAMAPGTALALRLLLCDERSDCFSSLILLYLDTSNCFAKCPTQIQRMCDPVSVYFSQIVVR
jgi:hypothetical protein